MACSHDSQVGDPLYTLIGLKYHTTVSRCPNDGFQRIYRVGNVTFHWLTRFHLDCITKTLGDVCASRRLDGQYERLLGQDA
jgi:hypothetical protein